MLVHFEFDSVILFELIEQSDIEEIDSENDVFVSIVHFELNEHLDEFDESDESGESDESDESDELDESS